MRRALLLMAAISMVSTAQKSPFNIQSLLQVVRLGEPALSPDGELVAYTAGTVDINENKQIRHIYVVPVSGGFPRKITNEGTSNERPRWSPDSKQIAYVSNRDGSSQIWVMNADGSSARQVTRLSTEASGVSWSPDGKHLVFVSEVYPDCTDDACNKKKLDAEKNSKVKARVYTSLLYRHWTEWQGNRRKHLFSVPAEGGTPKDLMTESHFDVPPFSLGGPDDYVISQMGRKSVMR